MQMLSFYPPIFTVRAESVGGDSTPGASVTWSTTLPPVCVASVRVNFRTATNRVLAATYTTTNTSQTEVIQTGLQCGTYQWWLLGSQDIKESQSSNCC